MNEERALYAGCAVIGAILVIAQLFAEGPVGTSATVGMFMILLGIRGLRSGYKLPRARVVSR
jgi:uncharacterized membrane protein YeiH